MYLLTAVLWVLAASLHYAKNVADEKYLFLYDPARQVTSIIPTSNIAHIRVDRKRPVVAPQAAPEPRAAGQ